MNDDLMQTPLRTFYHQPPTPPQPVGYSIPLPEKMQLRVVEYTKDDRIVKVEMQYCVHYYDQYGSKVSSTEWNTVPRIRIDMDGDL